jgi:hypothetical protein
MWGLFGTSTTLLSSFLLALQVTTGASGSVTGQVATTVFGLVSAGTVTLAFVPPRAYVERLRARAAARS